MSGKPSANQSWFHPWNNPQQIRFSYSKMGLPHNINSTHYCKMNDKWKAATQRKFQGQLLQGVLFLHKPDNSQTVIRTVEILWQLHSEMLEHPPYSPGLASSDHHLCVSLKKALRGYPFTTDHKEKTWCICLLALNQHFFSGYTEACSLLDKSVMMIMGIMCKNYAPTHFLSLLL